MQPEECSLQVRSPEELCHARIPNTLPPVTVDDEFDDLAPLPMALDECIRIALRNSQVVRVLAGVQATSSGSTIYDPAITGTTIEGAKARFDPNLTSGNAWNRLEQPGAQFIDPPVFSQSEITGLRTDNFNHATTLSKDTLTGGTAGLGVNVQPNRSRPGNFPLNPQTRSSVDLSYTQPLLRGAGIGPNIVPIVLARIDTERSFFRLKDSVQELVRGVVEAYWSLVFARVDLWVREEQMKQTEFAFKRAQAQFKAELADAAIVAQTELAYQNFRVSVTAARSNLLLREAALRNIMGLPPADGQQLQPTTPPSTEPYYPDWDAVLQLAEVHRPDIIELKLILEADQQLLVQANNQALPNLDAQALYRWNGLEGEMPIGDRISTRPGQFTDWTMSVNFAVPLSLRQSRANLRRQELLIARDRVNLDQGMHNVVHILTINRRNLAQFYQQYERLREARRAATTNLNQQFSNFEKGRVNFINVSQAISDWGNTVSSEAQTLILYNTELINLERQTGTILETHGVRFYEERFASVGPLGRFHDCRCYPRSMRPTENTEHYPSGDGPAESLFDLQTPRKESLDSRPADERDDESKDREPPKRPEVPDFDQLPIP